MLQLITKLINWDDGMRVKVFFFSYFLKIVVQKNLWNFFFFYKTFRNFIWKLGKKEKRKSALVEKKKVYFYLKKVELCLTTNM